MKIFEAYGYGKYCAGIGTIRASGGDCGPGSEMLCVGRTWQRNYGGAPTLTGDHENRVTDYTALSVHPQVTGALCANSHPGSYTGQDAFNDMLPVTPSDKPPRKYIVRRLTPLECCRLQGFPDDYLDGVEGSDSAKYKLWGNGMALPNMLHVMRGIVRMEAKDTE